MRRLVLAAVLAAGLAPLAPAHACYQKVLLEQHDTYTVVNVPTSRCGTTSVTIPVGIK